MHQPHMCHRTLRPLPRAPPSTPPSMQWLRTRLELLSNRKRNERGVVPREKVLAAGLQVGPCARLADVLEASFQQSTAAFLHCMVRRPCIVDVLEHARREGGRGGAAAVGRGRGGVSGRRAGHARSVGSRPLGGALGHGVGRLLQVRPLLVRLRPRLLLRPGCADANAGDEGAMGATSCGVAAAASCGACAGEAAQVERTRRNVARGCGGGECDGGGGGGGEERGRGCAASHSACQGARGRGADHGAPAGRTEARCAEAGGLRAQ
eukprot:350682-Chlamydomonas_euryale.AAC.3